MRVSKPRWSCLAAYMVFGRPKKFYKKDRRTSSRSLDKASPTPIGSKKYGRDTGTKCGFANTLIIVKHSTKNMYRSRASFGIAIVWMNPQYLRPETESAA